MQNETAKNPTLRSDGKLRLITAHARRLVRGRRLKSEDKKVIPPIVGLLNFASMLRIIWLGARQDDPYADLWLIRVHQALQNGNQELLQMHSAIDNLFKKIPEGVELKIAQTAAPVEMPLRFSTPYAFSAAYFLCSYDKYICKLLTARHVGILSWKGAVTDQNRAGKLVRRTFLSPTGYRFTGVTRADIANNTRKAIFAVRQMGMVPKSVLDGTERAPYAPVPIPPPVKSEQNDEAEKASTDTAQSG